MTILKVECDPKGKLVESVKMADRIKREGYMLKFPLDGFYFVTDAPEALVIELKAEYSWIKGWKRIQI